MAAISVEMELCGQTWIGKVVSPSRPGADIKTPDLDAALGVIRAACIAAGAQVADPAEGVRFPRHTAAGAAKREEHVRAQVARAGGDK